MKTVRERLQELVSMQHTMRDNYKLMESYYIAEFGEILGTWLYSYVEDTLYSYSGNILGHVDFILNKFFQGDEDSKEVDALLTDEREELFRESYYDYQHEDWYTRENPW